MAFFPAKQPLTVRSPFTQALRALSQGRPTPNFSQLLEKYIGGLESQFAGFQKALEKQTQEVLAASAESIEAVQEGFLNCSLLAQRLLSSPQANLATDLLEAHSDLEVHLAASREEIWVAHGPTSLAGLNHILSLADRWTAGELLGPRLAEAIEPELQRIQFGLDTPELAPAPRKALEDLKQILERLAQLSPGPQFDLALDQIQDAAEAWDLAWADNSQPLDWKQELREAWRAGHEDKVRELVHPRAEVLGRVLDGISAWQGPPPDQLRQAQEVAETVEEILALVAEHGRRTPAALLEELDQAWEDLEKSTQGLLEVADTDRGLICPMCSRSTPKGPKVCSHCGARLPDLTPLEGGAGFAVLAGATTPQVSPHFAELRTLSQAYALQECDLNAIQAELQRQETMVSKARKLIPPGPLPDGLPAPQRRYFEGLERLQVGLKQLQANLHDPRAVAWTQALSMVEEAWSFIDIP